MRRGPGTLYRKAKSVELLLSRDRQAVRTFLRPKVTGPGWRDRLRLLGAFVRTTNAVRGYHTLTEMLQVTEAILHRPGAVVVEAGVGKGASTAKLSLAVREVGGVLHAFDTFRGIPANDEEHTTLDGRAVVFREGAFAGTLTSVRRTVERYGAAEVCTFHKGLLADTLSELPNQVDVALLDVDLVASTRTCLEAILPRMHKQSILFSQDGHLQATVDLLSDPTFFARLGTPPPTISGLGTSKLLVLHPT